MYTLKIENTKGEIFELTNDSTSYYIVGIQGLTRPPTAVNTSTGGTVDGSFFNSARVEQRNIVINVVLNGNIEASRQRLYEIFPMKTQCTVYFENANRSVQINGYVEVLEGDLFTQREQMQISIICPRPYFEDLNAIYTELSNIMRKFEFPFAITDPVPLSEIVENPLCTVYNGGDVECGCTMVIQIHDLVSGATLTDLKLYDITHGTFFGINRTFRNGDEITICTVSGRMSITLNRNGTIQNILNSVTAGSTWFKLSPGNNDFSFTSSYTTNPAVRVIFALANLYGGV